MRASTRIALAAGLSMLALGSVPALGQVELERIVFPGGGGVMSRLNTRAVVGFGQPLVMETGNGVVKLELGFYPEGDCRADLNGDDTLNFFDVSEFIQAFTAMDPAADFTGDGLFNFFDVSAFIQAYLNGCP